MSTLLLIFLIATKVAFSRILDLVIAYCFSTTKPIGICFVYNPKNSYLTPYLDVENALNQRTLCLYEMQYFLTVKFNFFDCSYLQDKRQDRIYSLTPLITSDIHLADKNACLG